MHIHAVSLKKKKIREREIRLKLRPGTAMALTRRDLSTEFTSTLKGGMGELLCVFREVCTMSRKKGTRTFLPWDNGLLSEGAGPLLLLEVNVDAQKPPHLGF